MKRSSKAGIILVALFGFAPLLGIALSATEASAQAPVQVVLTGQVLTAKETGQVNTYFLYVGDKKIRYRVDQGYTPAVDMEAQTIYDLLGDIGAPRIHVVGADKALSPLTQSGAEGKHLRIEGALYPADAVLTVTSVEEVQPKKK
jgi:hypothetical protein